jgi:hypothetical protein
MLFLINEQYLTSNGTVMSRRYAHQETFAEMKDVQEIQTLPLMNGSQFIAWYVCYDQMARKADGSTWSSNLISGGCQVSLHDQ